MAALNEINEEYYMSNLRVLESHPYHYLLKSLLDVSNLLEDADVITNVKLAYSKLKDRRKILQGLTG